MRPAVLPVTAIDAAAFAPFGELIAASAARSVVEINDGTAQRFHDLARIDCQRENGRTVVSLFRAQPRALPFRLRMLERHRLGSQAFIPLDPRSRYLVVVAVEPSQPRGFLVEHGAGVNFRAGTWHHPLLALDRVSDFLVLDREGDEVDCETVELAPEWQIAQPATA